MKTNEKREILKDIFRILDEMNDEERKYIFGYVQGFRDKHYIGKINCKDEKIINK